MDDGDGEEARDDSNYYFCEDVNSSFSILSMNIRSVKKNLSKFIQILQRLPSAQILNFQETWKLDGSESIPGYSKFISQTRKHRAGGGCAIAIADGVQYKEVESIFLEGYFESVAVEFTHKGNIYTCFNIYCPPKAISVDEIVECMLKLKSKANKKSKLIFLGDFNQDVNRVNDPFIPAVLDNKLPPPLFTSPTRITKTSATSLDLIFTSIPDIFGGILYTSVTDHFATFLGFHGRQHSNKISLAPDHSSKALEKLRIKLAETDFTDILNDNSTAAFNKFETILYAARDLCCPVKKKRNKAHIHNPWFTKGFLISCRRKDKLHQRAKVKNTDHAWKKFKEYNQAFDRLCRAAKLFYYNKQFTKNKNDMKATWNLANTVMGRGNKKSGITTFPGCKSDKDIAETFSKHYNTVATNIASKIQAEKSSSLKPPSQFLPKEIVSIRVANQVLYKFYLILLVINKQEQGTNSNLLSHGAGIIV